MDAFPDAAGHPYAGVALVAVLVALNGFFVASEFSLVGARRTRLEELAQAGDTRAALALKATARIGRYISATQLGITLTSLGLGWVGEPALAHIVGSAFDRLPSAFRALATHGVAVVIAFALITIFHIVLGELVPKALALVHPEEVACWLVPPLMAYAFVMTWPVSLLSAMSNKLLRLAHIDPPGETERVHSPEEIRMLVEQSSETGTLHAHDARLLEGVFEFSEKSAEEVMTPRTQIVALEADLSLSAAADIVAEAQISRYPVYRETLDDIVGVVHAKDLFTVLRKGAATTLTSIMRPPLFVPATNEVEDVLAAMKRQKAHLAVVLDEHGGTSGIVTMEDLLEEIVGPIPDEHDVPEQPERVVGGDTIVDGAMVIADFNSTHELKLDDRHYNTVGGFVFGALGRLPRRGDRVAVPGCAFEVLEMEGRRVKTVVLHPEGTTGAGAAAGVETAPASR
jgi:CBS domain containing-hemolysin-like protein